MLERRYNVHCAADAVYEVELCAPARYIYNLVIGKIEAVHLIHVTGNIIDGIRIGIVLLLSRYCSCKCRGIVVIEFGSRIGILKREKEDKIEAVDLFL